MAILTQKQVQALEKLRDQASSLEEVTTGIRQGLVTSKDSVFLLNKEEVEAQNLENDLWKPLARGEDVSRWTMAHPDTRVFYPYTANDQLISEKELEEKYPNTHDYLLNDERI